MWFRNVREAFLGLFVWEGLLSFLIQLDRLGNALSGGNPKATISGRTGFYSIARRNPYWRFLEAVIDFSFKPIDGEEHCYQAWKNERSETHRRGNDVGLFLLSILVLAACPLICVFTYGSKLWTSLTGSNQA